MPNKFNTPMDTIVFTTKTILNGKRMYCMLIVMKKDIGDFWMGKISIPNLELLQVWGKCLPWISLYPMSLKCLREKWRIDIQKKTHGYIVTITMKVKTSKSKRDLLSVSFFVFLLTFYI